MFPGTTYSVARRCAQREYLLRPGPEVNQLFLYVLALAAERYSVQVHAVCVLSNHYHLVVTDPEAQLPKFSQYLNALVARAMNRSLRRREAFWAPPPGSAVALASPDDTVAKVAYALANPVAAGLVRHGEDWPGVWLSPAAMNDKPIVVRRPDAFFRTVGELPETVELRLSAPPGFSSPEEFRDRAAGALARAEEEAAAKIESEKRTFGSAEIALATATSERPTSIAPRRNLNPCIAARDTATRIAALLKLKEFRKAYREAREKFRAGARDTVFPAGTYLMRVLHGVPCAVPA